MKKQLLIAAVAATMTTAAMADISITGQAIVKAQTNSGAAKAVTNEYKLTIKGTSGDNTAVVKLKNKTIDEQGIVANFMSISEAYVTTKLEGISVTAGSKKGGNASALVANKSAAKAKFILSTSVAGAKITLKQVSGVGAAAVDVSTAISGVKVTVKNVMNDTRYFLVDADVAGVAVHVESGENSDGATETAYTLSGDVAGIALTYVAADVMNNNNSADNGVFGDTSYNATNDGLTDVTGFIASTSTAAGKVTVKRWDATEYANARTKVALSRGNATYYMTTSDKEDTDATIGAKIKFKF